MWPPPVETGCGLSLGSHKCAHSNCSRHCLVTSKALGDIVRTTPSWSWPLVPGEAEEAKQTRVPPRIGSDPGKSWVSLRLRAFPQKWVEFAGPMKRPGDPVYKAIGIEWEPVSATSHQSPYQSDSWRQGKNPYTQHQKNSFSRKKREKRQERQRGRKELVLSTAGQFVLKPFKLWKELRNVFPGAGGSGPRGPHTRSPYPPPPQDCLEVGLLHGAVHSRGRGIDNERPRAEAPPRTGDWGRPGAAAAGPVRAAVGDPEHMRLGERSQMQKATHCMLPFPGSVQNGRIHRKRQKEDERLHRRGAWGDTGSGC